jgi:hypothetical protein
MLNGLAPHFSTTYCNEDRMQTCQEVDVLDHQNEMREICERGVGSDRIISSAGSSVDGTAS